MLDINEIRKYLQAFEEGQTIEYFTLAGKWSKVETLEGLLTFITSGAKFRIKRLPKLLPYKDRFEFLKESKDKWLEKIDLEEIVTPININDNGIVIMTQEMNPVFIDYNTLCAYYRYSDGQPCGIMEEIIEE